MKPRIFLDQDGVMVNLDKRIFEYLKIDRDEVYARWPIGVYEMGPALGFDGRVLWDDMIGREPAEWWASIEPYPWAKGLYDKCCSVGDTYFLTAPINSPASCAGKLEWMYRFTGNRRFRKYFLGPDKFNCARFNHILIDDKESNCEMFEADGGKAILFPRRWNKLHDISEDPCKHVFEELDRLAQLIEDHHRPAREVLP